MATKLELGPPSSVVAERHALLPAALSQSLEGFLFVLPTVLMLAVVLLLPIATAVVLSFEEASPAGSRFVGLANFQYLMERSSFWNAFANTTVFTVISVVAHIALGLVTAVLVNERIHGRMVIRVSLLVPWVVATVVVGVTWRWIYDPVYGVLNSMLSSAHLISDPIAWLADGTFAMPAVLFTNSWHGYAFMMVMLLAGLQAIAPEQYEAAMIDGASAWQRFRYITLPHLRYIIMIGVTLDTIWQFRSFDIIQVTTMGGPMGATEVLSTLIYREMFQNLRFGMAAAIGTLLFVITTMLSLIYIAMLKDTDE